MGEKIKRKDVFTYLREKNYSIYCIQDTHFTEDKEFLFRNEWGYECYFNSYKSNSRGVAVLFNNNFEFKVIKEKKDLTGNFLALDLEIEGEKLTLITIYGPNSDSPAFYDQIEETIYDFKNDKYIVCGDFNLVLDPELDYDQSYKKINNPRARERVLDLIDNLDLVDVFRQQHSNLKRYTWRKHSPLKQSRLDFFLVSGNLLPSIFDTNIDSGYRSDHSFPKLSLKFNDFKKGKGLWKLNNSLLHDQELFKSCK